MNKLFLSVSVLVTSLLVSADDSILELVRGKGELGQALLQAEQILVFNGYTKDGELTLEWDEARGSHRNSFSGEMVYKSETGLVKTIVIEGTYFHSPSGGGVSTAHLSSIQIK